MSDVSKRWLWFVLLVSVGAVSRWLPHPPNFSALMAVAIFAGFVLPGPLALMTPLVSIFVGDLSLGFHDQMAVVYLSLLTIVWLGRRVPTASRGWRLGLGLSLAGLLGSILFFVTTNLAVFWSSGIYPHTEEGLVSCFVLAIPFFHNSVLSTFIYSAALMLIRQLQPSYSPTRQTVEFG